MHKIVNAGSVYIGIDSYRRVIKAENVNQTLAKNQESCEKTASVLETLKKQMK